MTTLSTRQTFALVVLFVATSVAFIQLDNRQALDPVKATMEGALAPAVNALNGIGRGGSGGSDPDTERELTVLKTQISELQAENATLRAEGREVEQLRMQAKLQEEQPSWTMLQARVQSPDPNNQQKLFIIDKGSTDKIEPGMAVVAQGRNYIGQVTEVSENQARVTLIIDVTQRVGARLDSGADGVIFGMWQNGGRLEMRYLDRDAEPEAGELVLTTDSASRRTARVPGGLIVGIVGAMSEPERENEGRTAPVIPQVAFEELEVVTVILTDEE